MTFEETEAVLPWEDDSIDALEPHTRSQVGRYWQGRAVAELQVADSFAQAVRLLDPAGANAEVMRTVRTVRPGQAHEIRFVVQRVRNPPGKGESHPGR